MKAVTSNWIVFTILLFSLVYPTTSLPLSVNDPPNSEELAFSKKINFIRRLNDDENSLKNSNELKSLLKNPMSITDVDGAISRCVGLGQTCSASTDCCGYPKAICILYIGDSSWATICSPTWMIIQNQSNADTWKIEDAQSYVKN